MDKLSSGIADLSLKKYYDHFISLTNTVNSEVAFTTTVELILAISLLETIVDFKQEDLSKVDSIKKLVCGLLSNNLQTKTLEQKLNYINSACLSYRHDFGLLSNREQEDLKFTAKEWLIAWEKALDLN